MLKPRPELLEQVTGQLGARRSAGGAALKWAARLHEIGLDVAHSGYHRHGAYLLQNADMPGFGREEQFLLARWSAATGASSTSMAWRI